MLPFLVPVVRRYSGLAYQLWVALGGGIALVCESELGSLGDPRPTMYQYFTPGVIAFMAGFVFSMISQNWLRYVPGLTKRWRLYL
jgi:hypothetical protein